MNNEPSDLPILGNDAQDRMLNLIQRFDSSFRFHDLFQVLNFPYASDYELILHYTRGAAGPFIDVKKYADVGVGWTFKPVGFKDTETGDDAKEKAETFMQEIEFNTTMDMFATWYESVAKACIIETKNKLGEYYQNPNLGITGVDCINPTTLTPESIDLVLNDPTGKAQYVQSVTASSSRPAPKFDRDRVIYRTQNDLSKRGAVGNSKLQRCIIDLRTAGFFPHYRRELGQIYSQMSRVIKINTEKLLELDIGKEIMKTNNTMQDHLDRTADFYRLQEEKGGTFVIFDFEEIDQSSFAGKEVKMVEIEMQTYESIGWRVGVPLALVMSAAATNINRATLDSITALFVSMQEKGTRNHIYTPIIERVANNYINSLGINGGHLEVEYNPFLPKDMLQVSQIIQSLWTTGAFSDPEIREMAGKPNVPYMGGKEWEELGINPMPQRQTVTAAPAPAHQEKKVDPALVKSVDLYLEKRGLVKFY